MHCPTGLLKLIRVWAQILAATFTALQSVVAGISIRTDGHLGPSFYIDWVTVDVKAFDEYLISSNGGAAIGSGWATHIEKQKYESLQPAIGFSFSKAVSASWGVLVPQGYIDVIAEIRDSGVIVNGHFIGDANSEQFGLLTDDFEDTFIRAGLGVGLVLKNNKSAFFMADGEFGRDLLKTYFLNAGFRWQF